MYEDSEGYGQSILKSVGSRPGKTNNYKYNYILNTKLFSLNNNNFYNKMLISAINSFFGMLLESWIHRVSCKVKVKPFEFIS